jgi:hypothetical protein
MCSHLCCRFVVPSGEVIWNGGGQLTEEQCKKKQIQSGDFEPEGLYLRHHHRRAAVADVGIIEKGVGHLPLRLTIGT